MQILAIQQAFTVSGQSMLELLFAALPVIILIILMGFLKMPGDKSSLITLIVSILVGLFVFHYPLADTGLSIVYGMLKAIFPILIIIIMAVFSYNILVHTKKMEVLKAQFSSVSTDKSIQVLLLTWGFGGLLEGMAGFGTAVAIPAAILISLGFQPVFSAVTSLIANSVATAFGAIGTPVIVLAQQTGITDLALLGQNVIFQLSPLMFLVPFTLLIMTDPRLKIIPRHIFLSVLVGSVSLLTQYLSVKYIGVTTPAVLGSLASIVTIVIYGKLTKSKQYVEVNKSLHRYTLTQTLKAWSVYGSILLLIVLMSPLLPFKAMLQDYVSFNLTFNIFDNVKQMSVAKIVKISCMDAGVLLFLGSIIGGIIQGAGILELFKLLMQVLIKQKRTIITVCSLIALSSIMDFSGMILVIGMALALATGSFYPLFAPAIGCLGTFLTGSDTSSNILFGKLQTSVAHQIPGADPSWFAAANTAGATGGKIISPQSIAVATSACEQQGKEGEIMKKALPFALAYIIIVGIMVYFF